MHCIHEHGLGNVELIGHSGSANEDQLMDYIARYARVQSCIVNHDKRHAFLKLISHQDAINAKQAIDSRPEAEYRNLFERVCPLPCSFPHCFSCIRGVLTKCTDELGRRLRTNAIRRLQEGRECPAYRCTHRR